MGRPSQCRVSWAGLQRLRGHVGLKARTRSRPEGAIRPHASRTCSTGSGPKVVLHWQHHHRPISAETLRKRMRVGSPTARQLVTQLRRDMDIHTWENQAATESQAEPDA